MLEFFRRYQKAFYIVITVVIVISFSFFGTFQAMHGRDVADPVAFTAIDGSKVMASELNDMIAFLSQDNLDALFSGRPIASNGLNDGVIAHDFIDTGLAQVIAASYIQEIEDELQPKRQREKRYRPYEHPKAPFVSAKQVWNYYAPDVAKCFTQLQNATDQSALEQFNTRLRLFTAERQFPSAYLRQFLRYQESMHKWLTPDQNLPYYDLNLFGYASSQDWFGRRFVELVAEFVINSAKYARMQGMTVSKDEALGSLFQNSEQSYRDRSSQNLISAQGPSEYFQEQLRTLSMDQGRAVAVWSQVLLFRRLFYDNSESVLATGLGFEEFLRQMHEYVDIDLYRLPKQLRFSSLKDLQKCIIYHNAVTDKANQKPYFTRPVAILSADQVKKTHPELVEKAYRLSWKEANKELLQMKVPLKEMWQWQVADSNWQLLVEHFSELGTKSVQGDQERLQLLDGLDPARRVTVDTFSRQQIVQLHPEWLTDALQNAPEQTDAVLLRRQGGALPFTGIKDREQLMELLNRAATDKDAALSLMNYSQDGVHYYSISVLDGGADEVVLSFEKATSDSSLDGLIEKNKQALDAALNALDAQVLVAKETYPDLVDWNDKTKARIAAYFLPYMQFVKNEIKKDPSQIEVLIVSEDASDDRADKLISSRERIVRKDKDALVDPATAYTTPEQTQSSIGVWPNTGLAFFTVTGRGFLPTEAVLREKTLQMQRLCGNDAICSLGEMIVMKMQGPKE